jgi:hypothetical protein
MEPEIIKTEVEIVLRKAPRNKTPGIDNIPAELLVAVGETGISWLLRIFNAAWQQQAVLDDWKQAIIIPIWKKKGSKRGCSQYRGISLLSHIGNLFAKLTENRIRPILELQLNDSQMGFRKDRSCTDALFVIKQLTEKVIEYDRRFHAAFIGQEKAFDRVSREQLCEILAKYGVSQHMINVCKSYLATIFSKDSRVVKEINLFCNNANQIL